MGCFSWITQDTNKAVRIYKKNNKSCVFLWDNEGNKWKEFTYEGYGVFGGKDYFVLLYEMNADTSTETKQELKTRIELAEKRQYQCDLEGEEDEEFQNMRQQGIDLYYSGDSSILFPNITESSIWVWRNEKPKDDPLQGF